MAIVLVHGSHFDGGLWDKCAPFLFAPSNDKALAVHLPGRPRNACADSLLNFDAYAAAVVAQMDRAAVQSATIVGHSLAGATLCALVRRIPERIDRLIFLSAVVPNERQRLIDAMPPGFQALIQEQHAVGAAYFDVPDPVLPIAFNDCTQEQIDFVLRCRSPEPIAPYFENISLQGMENRLPCIYIKTLQDQIFTPDMQEGFIRNLPACDVITMNTGHFPMLSRPQELAKVIGRMVRG